MVSVEEFLISDVIRRYLLEPTHSNWLLTGEADNNWITNHVRRVWIISQRFNTICLNVPKSVLHVATAAATIAC